MATLDRRVQVLLDPRQYSALEREAASSRRSVASIIRESVDRHLGIDLGKRRAALDRLLLSADRDGAAPMPDWDEIKREIEEDFFGNDPGA